MRVRAFRVRLAKQLKCDRAPNPLALRMRVEARGPASCSPRRQQVQLPNEQLRMRNGKHAVSEPVARERKSSEELVGWPTVALRGRGRGHGRGRRALLAHTAENI